MLILFVLFLISLFFIKFSFAVLDYYTASFSSDKLVKLTIITRKSTYICLKTFLELLSPLNYIIKSTFKHLQEIQMFSIRIRFLCCYVSIYNDYYSIITMTKLFTIVLIYILSIIICTDI